MVHFNNERNRLGKALHNKVREIIKRVKIIIVYVYYTYEGNVTPLEIRSGGVVNKNDNLCFFWNNECIFPFKDGDHARTDECLTNWRKPRECGGRRKAFEYILTLVCRRDGTT